MGKLPSKIVVVRNWMGGTNVRQLLLRLLSQSKYKLVSPEIDAWGGGEDTGSSADNLSFEKEGIVYYFRRPDVFLKFYENNKDEMIGVDCALQVRNPLDLLIAEYYGNALCHGSPLGKEAQWRKMRRSMIEGGLFDYVESKLPSLNLEYNKIMDRVGNSLITMTYENMVCNPHTYVSDLVKVFGLNDVDVPYYASLIDVRANNSEIKSMKRVRRPEEWPGPGRFRYEFSCAEQDKLTMLILEYCQRFGFWGSESECLGAPPKKSFKISRFNMWVKYILRFELKERFKRLLRTTINGFNQ